MNQTPLPFDDQNLAWQHNLKHGLIRLFSGAGLEFVFYYLGHPPVSEEIIQAIREASQRELRALPLVLSLIWLFPLISAVKGAAQIIYAAFFAESMATLAERFTPPPLQLEQSKIEQELPPNVTADFSEPPPSVTEHTTKIFEEQVSGVREQGSGVRE